MKIGIVCDCHNTLVHSNEAWINSFVKFLGEEYRKEIELYLYGKKKRRDLAQKYSLNFKEVESCAEQYVVKQTKVIEFLVNAKKSAIKLFVVSNAPRRRVVKDLETVGIQFLFETIYSKEDGGKSNDKIFDEILRNYRLDFLLFLGNEEFDDDIKHPRVLSVVLTEFLLQRFNIVQGYRFNKDGVLENGGEKYV